MLQPLTTETDPASMILILNWTKTSLTISATGEEIPPMSDTTEEFDLSEALEIVAENRKGRIEERKAILELLKE
jgi:hypothetical protein